MADDTTQPPAAARVPADAVASGGRPTERITPAHLYRAVALAFLLALVCRYWDDLTRVFLLGYAAAILAVILNALRRRLNVRRKRITADGAKDWSDVVSFQKGTAAEVAAYLREVSR